MIRVSIFILLIIITCSAFAQNSERFYNISRRDGLASGSITSIVQDHQGLIWIGTKQGLNRYDGVDFLHFHTGNSGITSNDISALFVDSSNILWIGTFGNGLHKLDLATNKIEAMTDQNIGNRVHSIIYGGDSTILILSNQGVSNLKSNRSPFESDLSFQISNRASAVVRTGLSTWVGTNDGELYKIDKNSTYVSYSLAGHSPNIFIQKIHPLNENELLIGTRRHGLLVFNTMNQALTKLDIEAIDIRDIIQDSNGKLWIGTDGQGVYSMNGSKITRFNHTPTLTNSLVSNAIQVCFEDRDENLWFGTAWDGISLLDSRLENLKFYYSDFKGTAEAGVLNIFIENENLWFGTDGSGLSVKSTDKVPNELAQFIPSNSYVQFIEKINGRYWIGTFQSGFFVAEDRPNGNKAQFTTNSGLSHDDVRDIESIDFHTYLIATWGGGLNIYDDRTNEFRKLGIGQEQPKDVVALHRLSEDKILVGTFGQGVFIFNTTDYSCTRILNELQNVVSFDGNESGVWFGTWGEGLHFASTPFSSSRLVTSEDLPGNSNIFSVLIDSKENETWLATSERILKITEQHQIQEMPFPEQQYHLNASTKDAFGRLYFGGTNGVISFNPKEIQVISVKRVEFLDVKILNQSLNEFQPSTLQTKGVVLNYDQNMVTFRYTTPVYPSSRNETYEVQLVPLNKDWIYVGRERSMTFADLRPGDYEFKVRNSSSKTEKSFRFRIVSPWWKTWWAYTITSLLFLGLLYSFRRYSIRLERVKNQLDIEKVGREKDIEIGNIKQRFFVNISHEIRTPLTLIIGEIEQLALKIGASKTVADSLSNLRNNGNHLIHLVNELLDFSKLDEGGLRLKVAEGNMVTYCREIYLSFLTKAENLNIDYDFYTSDPEIQVWYDRDQLEKVFYNLLSNAFKNTPPGSSIRFEIHQISRFVEVIIEDSGPGIAEKELQDIFKRFYQKEDDKEASRHGYGIGLSIVKEIVNLHKGNVSVTSVEGQGSKFTVRLKLGKEHFEEKDFIPEFTNSDSISGYTEHDLEIEFAKEPKLDKEVLIVEDNAEIRSFLIKILSHRFVVYEASNGLEASKYIESRLPDLIISDVMMPEMDGISLMRKIKRNPLTCHIPIILLTARTGTVFKKEGFDLGADDYITKPFSSAVLLSRIENILMTREMLTSQIRNELATKPNDLHLATPDERFLKDLVQVVQNNLDNSELNAELVAETMGMSHSVIYKKIKSLTGYNLVEFIREYRLQQASEILGKYKFTVAEACYKVGFSDKKYFTQKFKMKFGVTPSEFAKKHA